jgi:hypothetical protein
MTAPRPTEPAYRTPPFDSSPSGHPAHVEHLPEVH